MTHDEAIHVLKAGAAPVAAPGAPDATAQREAVDHVGRCSDCWQVLARLHEAGAGRPLAAADAMDHLFGCEDVQRQLHLLATLEPARLLTEHPGTARHLAWCEACRDGLIDVLVMEEAVRRGDVEPFEVALASASWQSAVNALGEQVHDLLGAVGVQVRRGIATFAATPTGVEVIPGLVGATRGIADTPSPELGQRATLRLGDSGLVATVAIDAHGDGRVHIAVAVTGPLSGPMSAELRAADESVPTLLAAHLFPQSPEVTFREVPTGDYVLELRERAASRRYRFRLRVDGRE